MHAILQHLGMQIILDPITIEEYEELKKEEEVSLFIKEIEECKNNIERLTVENTFYRRVIKTGLHSQVVLMSILPNSEIGMEVHPNIDQFIRFEKGVGKVLINGGECIVTDGDYVHIDAGSQHNVINIGNERLQLYTIYSPPHHPKGLVEHVKE